jgi:hypothetical protein
VRSSPSRCSRAVSVREHRDQLFVAGELDAPFDDDAQTLFSASTAREEQLEILSSSDAYGTGLMGFASVRALFDEFLRVHSD